MKLQGRFWTWIRLLDTTEGPWEDLVDSRTTVWNDVGNNFHTHISFGFVYLYCVFKHKEIVHPETHKWKSRQTPLHCPVRCKSRKGHCLREQSTSSVMEVPGTNKPSSPTKIHRIFYLEPLVKRNLWTQRTFILTFFWGLSKTGVDH